MAFDLINSNLSFVHERSSNFFIPKDKKPYSVIAFCEFCKWRDHKITSCNSLFLRVTSMVVFCVLWTTLAIQATVRVWTFILSNKTILSTTLLPHSIGLRLIYKAIQLNFSEKKIFPKLKDLHMNWATAKLAGHWLQLSQPTICGGENFESEGIVRKGRPLLQDSLEHALGQFVKSKGFASLSLPREKAEILIRSFKEMSEERSDLVSKIHNKELFLCSAGWSRHDICLAFFGNYLAIGNGGDKSDDHGTLAVYKIDPQLMTHQLLEKIKEQNSNNAQKGAKFFYEELPKKLSPSHTVNQDELCKQFQQINPYYQMTGNCVLSGIQAVIPFAWSMLLDQNPSPSLLHRADLESNLFLKWSAVYYGQSLKKMFVDTATVEVISKRIERMKTHFSDVAFYLNHFALRKLSCFSQLSFKNWKERFAIEILAEDKNMLESMLKNHSIIQKSYLRTSLMLGIISLELLGIAYLTASQQRNPLSSLMLAGGGFTGLISGLASLSLLQPVPNRFFTLEEFPSVKVYSIYSKIFPPLKWQNF